jgi:hypothetical protein
MNKRNLNSMADAPMSLQILLHNTSTSCPSPLTTSEALYHILSSDGADSKTMARFYLAMVQAKLLYGSETWVLSRRLLDRLKHFHARSMRTLYSSSSYLSSS